MAIRSASGILDWDGLARRCLLNFLSLGTLTLLTVACGGGEESEPDSVPVASTFACIAAAAGSASVGSNSAILTWDAVAHEDLCGYRIYYLATSLPTEFWVERCRGAGCSDFVEVARLPGTTYNDTNLAATTSYSYRVRAGDAAGSLSEYSTVATDVTFAAPMAPGLVAAYAFNEDAGTTVSDASGNNNNGAITDAVWVPSQVGYGNALEFNGTSAQVTIPNSASLSLTTAMTLEAWVFPTVVQGWHAVIGKNTGAYFLKASSASAISNPGGGPAVGGEFATGDQYTFGPAALTVNKWTHLGATFDGAVVQLYVNGVQVASQSQTMPLLPTTGTLQIGTSSPWGQFFAGRIDEVRIYNRALSVAEIQMDMLTPISPDLSPPAPPAVLTATGATAMQINLSWGASADDVGVSSYRIERCTGAACGTFVQVATAIGTNYVDTSGLQAETIYRYQVRGVDAAGNSSAPSNIANASTLASGTILPTAPGGVTAVTARSTQIDLTWGASTMAPGAYVQSIGQGINVGYATTHTLTGLSSGTRYYFAVTAYGKSSSESGFSNVVHKDFP